QYEAEPAEYYLHQKNVNDIQFSEKTTSFLKGTWSYYDHELITRPNPKLVSKATELPVSFKELTGSNIGYGTFIAHFKIPEQFIGRRLAIHIPNQSGAYRVYLNGDFLVRLGDVADNAEAQQTENAPRIAYFVPDRPYFTLSIQASNFNKLGGGLESPMHIGIAKTINRHYQQLMMSIAMICGAVFGVGLFTTMFSIFRGSDERNSKGIFVFGIFILFLALHNLFTAPYAYTTFLDINWLWGIRLEYLFIYLAVMFFLSYMYLLDQHYLQHWIYTISMLVLTLNIVITLLSEQEVFEQLAFYSAFFSIIILLNFAYGFFITLKTKQKYSKLNFCAVIVLCMSFIHDFLLTLHVIDSIHLSFISTSLY
ncbi:MAG: histidine kinase, partial [Acinetobacter sp.]